MSEQEAMTLGRMLRELRGSDPYMRLREMAAAVGVSPQEWSDIEADRVCPNRDLLTLASAFLSAGDQWDELMALRDAWREAPPDDLSGSICSGRKR